MAALCQMTFQKMLMAPFEDLQARMTAVAVLSSGNGAQATPAAGTYVELYIGQSIFGLATRQQRPGVAERVIRVGK